LAQFLKGRCFALTAESLPFLTITNTDYRLPGRKQKLEPVAAIIVSMKFLSTKKSMIAAAAVCAVLFLFGKSEQFYKNNGKFSKMTSSANSPSRRLPQWLRPFLIGFQPKKPQPPVTRLQAIAAAFNDIFSPSRLARWTSMTFRAKPKNKPPTFQQVALAAVKDCWSRVVHWMPSTFGAKPKPPPPTRLQLIAANFRDFVAGAKQKKKKPTTTTRFAQFFAGFFFARCKAIMTFGAKLPPPPPTRMQIITAGFKAFWATLTGHLQSFLMNLPWLPLLAVVLFLPLLLCTRFVPLKAPYFYNRINIKARRLLVDCIRRNHNIRSFSLGLLPQQLGPLQRVVSDLSFDDLLLCTVLVSVKAPCYNNIVRTVRGVLVDQWCCIIRHLANSPPPHGPALLLAAVGPPRLFSDPIIDSRNDVVTHFIVADREVVVRARITTARGLVNGDSFRSMVVRSLPHGLLPPVRPSPRVVVAFGQSFNSVVTPALLTIMAEATDEELCHESGASSLEGEPVVHQERSSTDTVVCDHEEEVEEEIAVDASVSDEFAIDESAINQTLRTDVPLVDVPSTVPLAGTDEVELRTVKSAERGWERFDYLDKPKIPWRYDEEYRSTRPLNDSLLVPAGECWTGVAATDESTSADPTADKDALPELIPEETSTVDAEEPPLLDDAASTVEDYVVPQEVLASYVEDEMILAAHAVPASIVETAAVNALSQTKTPHRSSLQMAMDAMAKPRLMIPEMTSLQRAVLKQKAATLEKGCHPTGVSSLRRPAASNDRPHRNRTEQSSLHTALDKSRLSRKAQQSKQALSPTPQQPTQRQRGWTKKRNA
jgi:hypothetical protein